MTKEELLKRLEELDPGGFALLQLVREQVHAFTQIPMGVDVDKSVVKDIGLNPQAAMFLNMFLKSAKK